VSKFIFHGRMIFAIYLTINIYLHEIITYNIKFCKLGPQALFCKHLSSSPFAQLEQPLVRKKWRRRCEPSHGSGGGGFSVLVARLLRRILVGALWRVWRGWSLLVVSASPPFRYIGPMWGWSCPRWCYAFRLRRHPQVR
jgi:hypothetical protein